MYSLSPPGTRTKILMTNVALTHFVQSKLSRMRNDFGTILYFNGSTKTKTAPINPFHGVLKMEVQGQLIVRTCILSWYRI